MKLKYNENFDFYFIGTVNPDIVDYYRIPFSELKDMLIDENLASPSHERPRWMVNIRNGTIKIGKREKNISGFRTIEVLRNFDFDLPEEIDNESNLFEGVRKQIAINTYERNPSARTMY